MDIDDEEYVWSEKYRPKTIDDCILPANIKTQLNSFIKTDMPPLLLSGKPGVGKTTCARALLEERGYDYIIINGSLNGNIDTLRNDIKQFASSVSFTSNRKFVILDEADYLNSQSTQPALRNFMDSYSKNCGFIFTCNYKNKIIEALQSRCATVDFTINKEDAPSLAKQLYDRIVGIVEREWQVDKLTADQSGAIAQLVKSNFPDFRKTINEVQQYANAGNLSIRNIASVNDANIALLISHLTSKNHAAARKWVAENIDNDIEVIFTQLYKQAPNFVKPDSIPDFIVTLADYQYKQAFVADAEINMAACLVELIIKCDFK